MKKKDVQIGRVYIVRVSGQLVRVKITSESVHGGWVGRSLKTGREIRIKTAGRLRKADPFAEINAELNKPGGLADCMSDFLRKEGGL